MSNRISECSLSSLISTNHSVLPMFLVTTWQLEWTTRKLWRVSIYIPLFIYIIIYFRNITLNCIPCWLYKVTEPCSLKNIAMTCDCKILNLSRFLSRALYWFLVYSGVTANFPTQYTTTKTGGMVYNRTISRNSSSPMGPPSWTFSSPWVIFHHLGKLDHR